jgi:hypothetical protein
MKPAMLVNTNSQRHAMSHGVVSSPENPGMGHANQLNTDSKAVP